jgi:hypothetical protein
MSVEMLLRFREQPVSALARKHMFTHGFSRRVGILFDDGAQDCLVLGLHFAKIIRVTGFRQRGELPARDGARTEVSQGDPVIAVNGVDRDGRREVLF